MICIYDNYEDILICLKSTVDSNICENYYVYYDSYDFIFVIKKDIETQCHSNALPTELQPPKRVFI